MQNDIVEQAEHLLAKATPGPWGWEISELQKTVRLASGKGKPTVMGFDRWGMASGTPVFRIPGEGFMKKAFCFSEVKNNVEDLGTYPKTINHPDANLIAQAPEIIRQLLDEVRRLRAAVYVSAPEVGFAMGVDSNA